MTRVYGTSQYMAQCNAYGMEYTCLRYSTMYNTRFPMKNMKGSIWVTMTMFVPVIENLSGSRF